MYCTLQIVDRVKWLERCALQPLIVSKKVDFVDFTPQKELLISKIGTQELGTNNTEQNFWILWLLHLKKSFSRFE
jgi:hypothetical protein